MSAIEGWSSFAVEQCCDILDSKRVPINAEDRDRRVGEIPYYGANGLQGYIDEFIFDEPLILIAEDGGCFDEFASRPIAYRIKGKSWVNNHAHVLRAKEAFDQDAVFYNLEHKDIQSFIVGGTRSKLNQSALRAITIYLPTSKTEQTKVAEILSTVDRAIEQTEALIAKQQRIKTGLMQDLLTRGIDEHGNLRSEQTHQFKDSPLGRVPMEWKVRRLGENCDICNNLRKPIAALVRETIKGDYPYYGPTGILDYINEYRVDGKFALIGEDGDHFLKFKTQEMTFLVDGKFNVNNHAHILRGKDNVLTEWLHLFFLHRDITLHLTRQGAGRFKLNKAALMELPLLAPKDPSEQDRILHVMNTLRRNQINSTNNLDKLKLKKTALMQDLLTGRKRVTAMLEKTL